MKILLQISILSFFIMACADPTDTAMDTDSPDTSPEDSDSLAHGTDADTNSDTGGQSDSDTDSTPETDSDSATELLVLPGTLSGTFLLAGQADHSGIVVAVEGTSLTTTTFIDGNWTIENVPAGQYSVVASHSGYVSVLRADQQVEDEALTQVASGTLELDDSLYLHYVSGGSNDGDEDATGGVTTTLAPFVVRVVNALGDPVENILVSFVSSNAADSIPPAYTEANGEASSALTLDSLAGLRTVVAGSTDTPTQTVTFVVNGQPAAVDHFATSGDAQEGEVGAALPQPIAITLYDEYDNPVPDVEINFTPRNGHGTVSQATVLTDANGMASVTWTLGTVLASDQWIDISAQSGQAIAISAANIAGPVTLLQIADGNNQIAQAGSALSTPLTVYGEDSYGNPAYGRTLTWTPEGGDTVDTVTVHLDPQGMGTTILTLDGTTGPRSVTGTADGQSVVFDASGSPHRMESLTPDHADIWTSTGDLQVTITGEGFATGSTVIWDAGGMELALTPDTISDDTITVTIPADQFSANRNVPVAVALAGDTRCTGLPFAVYGWVPIPGGTFSMGDEGAPESSPVHPVTVPTFEIMRTEVSVGQYEVCVNAGVCAEPSVHSLGGCSLAEYGVWNAPGREALPVACVEWSKANTYCAWIGGRLPSEAEWEYTARPVDPLQLFPWGDTPPTCDYIVMSEGTTPADAGCGTAGPFAPCSRPSGNTEQGVCDILGNVFEWNADPYHYGYAGAPDDGSIWTGTSDSRMYRGGSYGTDATYATPHKRVWTGPTGISPGLGFRCARDLP